MILWMELRIGDTVVVVVVFEEEEEEEVKEVRDAGKALWNGGGEGKTMRRGEAGGGRGNGEGVRT